MSIEQSFPDIKPSLNLDFANTKALDPRVTFTRASTGTYYDGQTFAKAEENLLTYSQEFDQSPWFAAVPANITLTGNTGDTTAPDGTSTAEKYIANNVTSADFRYGQLASGAKGNLPVTFSCFLKNGTAQYAYIALTEGSFSTRWAAVVIDLSTGTITQTSNGAGASSVSSSVTSVNNGWYRLIITATLTGGSLVAGRISYVNTGTPTITGNATLASSITPIGTESFYLWGAQIEQRDSVTAYTPTTTQPITNYIPVLQTASSGDPRFDHDPITGESKGLLIEEQRTNLFLRSQEFDDPYWVKGNTSIDSNVVVAPDGTLTGSVFYALSAGTARRLSRDPGSGPNVSIFCKKQPGSGVNELWIYNSANNNKGAGINLTTGVTTSLDANYTASSINVGNGWWRFNVTTQTIFGSVFLILYTDGAINVNVSGPLNGVYIWGAQLEAGSFPTSYIKTEASQVTRAADSASMTGTNFSDWYRPDEGTLYTDVAENSVDAAGAVFDLYGASVQRVESYYRSPSNGVVFVKDNGTNQAIINADQAFGKRALALAKNDVAVSLDGNAVLTDTTCTIPFASSLYIGSIESGSVKLNRCIKQIAYFPKRLTDEQLRSLTSS